MPSVWTNNYYSWFESTSMNSKLNWTQKAKKLFPDLKPTRAAAFTGTNDRKSLLIPCLDQPVCLIVNNGDDLLRLKSLLEITLLNRGIK